MMLVSFLTSANQKPGFGSCERSWWDNHDPGANINFFFFSKCLNEIYYYILLHSVGIFLQFIFIFLTPMTAWVEKNDSWILNLRKETELAALRCYQASRKFTWNASPSCKLLLQLWHPMGPSWILLWHLKLFQKCNEIIK